MATATEAARGAVNWMALGRSAVPAGDSRILLTGIDWSVFRALVAARGDRPVPRMTYDRGNLELMGPSYLHELLKERTADFVKLLLRGLGVAYRPAGSTLWTREDLDKGKEPDSCLYIENAREVDGLTEVDLTVKPPPDLAIEIVITRPLLDALRVYAGLGVPEVWSFDGQSLRFLHLQADGTYREREASRCLPILRSWEALGWLLRADALDELAWVAEVERWVRDEVVPRRGPAA
jgi:Uma2 family endonuclease